MAMKNNSGRRETMKRNEENEGLSIPARKWGFLKVYKGYDVRSQLVIRIKEPEKYLR